MALRIMTVNLFNGGAQPDALAALLDDERPDVVAVQELAENAAGVLRARYPHGELEPRDTYDGNGIVAARPMDVRRLPLPARDGFVARLSGGTWPELGAPLVVLAVHVANPIEWPWWRSLATRRAQLRAILREVARHREPLLLVGDLNSTPAWPLYRRLRSGLDDLATRAGTAHRTWAPAMLGDAPRLLRIDHAMGRGLRALATRAVPVAGSDHHALLVDVETQGGEASSQSGNR